VNSQKNEELCLLKEYTEKVNSLIPEIKLNVLSFLKGDINKNYLTGRLRKELEKKINEIESLYDELNKVGLTEWLNNELLEPIKESLDSTLKESNYEFHSFCLKPLESTLEKVLRLAFLKKGEVAISDAVRAKILVESRNYSSIKSPFLSSLYKIIENQNQLSFVYHNPFTAFVKVFNDIYKVKVSGSVFEDVSKEGNIYFYTIEAEDKEDANEIFSHVKTKLKDWSKKTKTTVSPIYKIELDKCYEDVFKGLNIYLEKKENKIYMFIIENPLLKRTDLKTTLDSIINKDFTRQLGLIFPSNNKKNNLYESYIARPHTGFEKVEIPILFKKLDIYPPETWYQESIVDEKVLSYTPLPSFDPSFFNVNLSVGQLDCEKTKYIPFGEIQVASFAIKRLDEYNPEFSHAKYEEKRIAKFVESLNNLVDNYFPENRSKRKDALRAILKYISPLLDKGIRNRVINLEEGSYKLSIRFSKDGSYLELHKFPYENH
jgi:hypothetical protein